MLRPALGAPMRAPTITLIASLALLTIVATLLPTDAFATTAAGRTKGSFAVSPTGAATYTIPIWSPPGPHGMQPSIALTYNSQQGNGYVGVGWSVSGLSSIYRCNLIYAQDAAAGPVALATSDGYCMDGQRLRLTGGTYGEAGSTYQTEVANFVNVTAYGSAGNGPAYWIAQDRNGRTYTYGNGGNSQVLATGNSTAIGWMLNEVSDPYSNTMTVAYSTTTGTAVPSTISWTPTTHGGSTYSYTMTFSYGTNVLPPQGFIGGTEVKNANLLSSIAVNYSGTAVKTYYLTYQTSPTTGRDELKQVQECSGTGTSLCFAPTVIAYQSGTTGVSTTATHALSAQVSYVHHDFNGDGFSDLLYVSGSTYYVSFGSASGFGAGVSTTIPTSAARILVGDLLGNGKDGILAAISGTWKYYYWNGSSFSSISTGLTYDSTAAQYLLADLNGDGLQDLIATYFTPLSGGGNTLQINTRLNTGNGTTVSFGSAVSAYTTSGPLLVQAQVASNADNSGGGLQTLGAVPFFDFNGDGRQDLSLQTITTKCTQNSITDPPGTNPPGPAPQTCTSTQHTFELTSNGSTFSGYSIGTLSGAAMVPITFLNFNSDACTDYLVGGTIYVAGCNGSVPSTVVLGNSNVIGAMDWNGDGLTDILVANGSTVGVYLSTGSGVSSLVSTSIPYSSANTYFTFDANGDGLDDLGYWTASATYYYLHNGAGTPPDLATSFTDAFGNSVKPTYVSLVENNYTPNTDATYPYQNWIGPMYVVNEAVFSDPSSASGGTYNQTFWYYGAWGNDQGRGWQAFYAIRDIDSRNALTYFTYFERAFPTTGMVFETTVSSGAVTTNATVNTLPTAGQQTTLPWLQSGTAHQQRYFPYFVSTAVTQKELGGSENGDTITSINTTYAFDNYGNPTSISTTVTDSDPGSPLTGQTWTKAITNTPDESTNPWCLNLFSATQTAYTDSNNDTAVTVTKTLSPDPAHCDYTQIVTQSNSGSSYAVTENIGYDAFGNLSSDSITGAGMAARTTTTSWTSSSVTTGQFPMSVTDPTGAQTQYNYNFSYGLKNSITDPNNLTTSWAYNDGFGRVNQETRPDGTYTVWAYSNCAGTSGCLLNAAGGMVQQIDVYAKNATIITEAENFYDSVDRLLVASQLMMDGSDFSRVDTRYDSLGRVAQQSFPCLYTSLTTTCTYWTTNTYDVLNRLTQSQRPISSTNSTLQTTSYAYAGRTTTTTDALSNAWTTVKDVNGWLRRTKDPYGYYVTLAYDAAGNKTAVTDSSSKSLWSATYNYGLGAFPATVTDIDMGTWTFTNDALGEKTAWKDAKNQSFSELYDALSRPLSRSEPDYFTQWTWGSTPASHNVGKLQSVCTGSGSAPTNCTTTPGYSESETYDSYARLSQRSMTLPGEYGGSFAYSFGYDGNTGLLSTLTYPASYPSTYSLQLQYGYSSGILQTVTDVSDTPNVTVWQANTTNPAGQITQEILGNGIVTNRSFDAVTSWLGSATSGVGGGSGVKNLAFLYDEMGNLTQRQDNNLGLTENVWYDNDYRFSYSQLNSVQNLSVSYATNGNITSRTDVASGASWTYSPTQIHAVTQAGSSAYQYAYDTNGNATSRQGSSIIWSSYNYPTSISAGSGSTAETIALSYGPDRQRWQQYYTGNSTTETTDYVGQQMEVVSSGGVTDYRHYVSGASGVVAVYSRKSNGTNTFSYLLSDHQASVASITSSSGSQVAGESFTAFGNRRNPSTWSGADSNADLTTIAGITREGYTFQTALGLWMGMNHMNGRVQDAVTGRMLSADPHIPNKGNTQSYNRYSYVNNNPLTATDLTGFVPCLGVCKPIDGAFGHVCQRCGVVDFGPMGPATGSVGGFSFDNGYSAGDGGIGAYADALGAVTAEALDIAFPGPDGSAATPEGGGDTSEATGFEDGVNYALLGSAANKFLNSSLSSTGASASSASSDNTEFEDVLQRTTNVQLVNTAIGMGSSAYAALSPIGQGGGGLGLAVLSEGFETKLNIVNGGLVLTQAAVQLYQGNPQGALTTVSGAAMDRALGLGTAVALDYFVPPAAPYSPWVGTAVSGYSSLNGWGTRFMAPAVNFILSSPGPSSVGCVGAYCHGF